jgi:hypothetical protein
MIKFLSLLLKRPSDEQIRLIKIFFWVILIIVGILTFGIQNLLIENTLFGIYLSGQAKLILAYIIMALWFFPLILGGLDINILSRGRTRILQIIFGIILIVISGIFVETATLSTDIVYFLLWLFTFIAGVTGKAITKKWLKTGQKITKIRV